MFSLNPILQTALYTQAGDYYPVVTVRTSVGSFTNKTGPSVPVAERLKIKVAGDDSPLVAWASFKKHMQAQDMIGAMQYVATSRREDCHATLLDLGADASNEMVQGLTNLTEVASTSEIAQYMAEVATPLGVLSFPVCFVKEDGFWRVDTF